MKLFTLLLLSHFSHAADCSTAAILNEASDYEACRVTIDGQDTDQKIPEDTCAAFCQLRQTSKKKAAHDVLTSQKSSNASSNVD